MQDYGIAQAANIGKNYARVLKASTAAWYYPQALQNEARKTHRESCIVIGMRLVTPQREWG